MIAEQEAHLDLLNQDIKGGFEKMHGLLSYALVTGGLSTEAALLHDSLSDFLNAKSASDRDATSRSVVLYLEHGNCFGVDPKAPDTAVLNEYERIADPERSSAFYRRHRDEIHSQLRARKDAANQP